ncbi:MAG: hypothetical protein AAGG48_13615 [Planctomycetota bacterium]
MILRFPNCEVLRLAIASEFVPQELAQTCVEGRIDDDGSVWLKSEETLRRKTLAELKPLGVQQKRSVEGDFKPFSCWHQLLPLSTVDWTCNAHQETLFQISEDETFAEMVVEMLRLGNDRQQFARLAEPTPSHLLRVTEAPHYTLLRATEAEDEPTAFSEAAPRVWVEYGFQHPLAKLLQPPIDHWLLIRSDQTWQLIHPPKLKDIYRAIDLSIESEHAVLSADIEPQRIRVPIRFNDSSATDPAELWVIQEDAIAKMESFIESSPDSLVRRLLFAVAEDPSPESHEPWVILRVRPSKEPPPILVIQASAYRSYLRIPNLFLPLGKRLQPPLRRDAVIQLIAPTPERVHWLMPGIDRGFTPQSVDDSAFLPLSDWVDYVLDHHAESLSTWVASHQFDFESFICDDELLDAPTKSRTTNKKLTTNKKRTNTQKKTKQAESRQPRKRPAQTISSELETTTLEPGHWELQLARLESDYRQSTEPLESVERSRRWSEMGIANSHLRRARDTTICFANACWNIDHEESENDSEEINVKERLERWLESELRCVGVQEQDHHWLDWELSATRPQDGHPGLIAALVIAGECHQHLTDQILEKPRAVIDCLLQHENRLPVRAAWMAWMSMYRYSGKDLLMLARARDRVLERLFHRGLTPEFDLPAFLRSDVAEENGRLRRVRDHLPELRESVRNWIVESEFGNQDPQTLCYVDLIFSYAFARLGEFTTCHELLHASEESLQNKDVVHRWILDAYTQRIQQAIDGQPRDGALNAGLTSALETMDRGQQYLIDRLRQRSRILEPHANVDAFENFLVRATDELGQQLDELEKTAEPTELASRLDALLDRHKNPDEMLRILPIAFLVAPRLGERYATKLIERVWSVIDACQDSFDQAALLHRAILVAAHFGRVDLVQSLVEVMDQSLPELVHQYCTLSPTDRQQTEAIERLLNQSFRGMRRLGMREQIERIYTRVAELIESTSESNGGQQSDRLLLSLAAGWFFFGQSEPARNITQNMMNRLQGESHLDPINTRLLCAYIEAVANAPAEEAVRLVRDVFFVDDRSIPKIANVAKSLSTDSHYSISHLDIVEAAVLALLSEDVALSSESRRWLDQDEYLVRQKIHRDMRLAVERAE